MKYNNSVIANKVTFASIEKIDSAFLDITDIGRGSDPTAVYSY